MTLHLPRKLDTAPVKGLSDLALRLFTFCNDVYEFLRSIPALEVRTFSTHGHYPIFVETGVTIPTHVLRTRSYETKTGMPIAGTGIAWRLSEDPRQPGIMVTELDGVPAAVGTLGEETTVTLLILGERGAGDGI